MKNKKFIELTKKQKLGMPIKYGVYKKIKTVLFIPTKKRNCDGYTLSAFFVLVKEDWYRLEDFDCFKFINANKYFRGDFEHDGVQFFLEDEWNSDSFGRFIKL